MPDGEHQEHVVEHIGAEDDDVRRLLVFLAVARIDIDDRLHALRPPVIDEALHIGVRAQLEFRIGHHHREHAHVRRRLGVGFAAEALAEAAIDAFAHHRAFGIGVGGAGVGRRLREGMIAELLGRLLEQHAGKPALQRLVGEFVAARPFEDIAAVDLGAAQVSRLARYAAQFLELVVMRLELGIGDAEILDRHLGRHEIAAVFLGVVRLQHVVGFETAPGGAVPMRAGAADIRARHERAQPPHRQRGLAARMAQASPSPSPSPGTAPGAANISARRGWRGSRNPRAGCACRRVRGRRPSDPPWSARGRGCSPSSPCRQRPHRLP